MYVIGTAGHVDHGKSTLIAALSGIHPDRLKEEIEREMTIDLGFAWFDLPDGKTVGVIDVPGHRDFIANMLAGIGGIDAVLLVIAADEGMMPQTKEHLAILDLLVISSGLVILNKIDLVSDQEWIDLVEMEVQEALMGTSLDGVPIIKVSSATRTGLNELKLSLQDLLEKRPPRTNLHRPRLPIDRIFSLPGFGTIVTGTLSDGDFYTGDEIEILPGDLKGRIRGLQSYKNKVDHASPGTRTAINITGVNKERIERGQVVIKPGTYEATGLLDCHCRVLKDSSVSLKHNMEVVFYSGSSEIISRIRILGKDQLNPGEEGYIQVHLSKPGLVAKGDHYVIRRPSPPETLGGGIILDPYPQKLYRRFNISVISRFNRLLQGEPQDLIIQQLSQTFILTVNDLVKKVNLPLPDLLTLVSEMENSGLLIRLDHEQKDITAVSPLISKQSWDELVLKVSQQFSDFYSSNPLKPGLPREYLRKLLSFEPSRFNQVMHELEFQQIIEQKGPLVLNFGHQISLSTDQERMLASLLEKFRETPFSPPDVKFCQELLGEDLLEAVIFLNHLVRISEDIVFLPGSLEKMIQAVRRHLQEHGTITLADLRDQFQTSRKYALPVLEYMDSLNITARKGEFRVLKSNS